MKKNIGKTLFGIIIFCTLLVFGSASASVNVSEFDENSTAVITGTVEASGEKKPITLLLIKNDTDLASVTSGNLKDYAVFYRQSEADAEGAFSVSLKLSGNSGYYKLYIGEYLSADPVYDYTLVQFVNPEANKAAVDKINALAGAGHSADEIKAVISDMQTALDLGLKPELYDLYDIKDDKYMSAAAGIIYNSIAEERAEYLDFSLINNAVLAVEFNSGRGVSGEALKKSALLINGGKMEKWYALAEEMSGDDSSFAVSKLKNKNFKDVGEFEYALGEAVILNIIKNPNGVNNIKGSLADFGSEIEKYTGYDVNDYDTSDFYTAVMANTYISLEDVFSGYTPNASGASERTGGGSGGGSGNSGGARGVTGYTSPSEPAAEYYNSFTDLSSAQWGAVYINDLSKKGIINGKTKTEFCPNDNITREEFVKLICALYGLSSSAEGDMFDDVDESAWYAPYVRAGVQSGIIKGIGDNKFGTGQFITRQDTAVIIYNALSAEPADAALEFSDADAISDYALEAVKYLYDREIINGYEDGSFRPLSTLTRVEAAKIIYLMQSFK